MPYGSCSQGLNGQGRRRFISLAGSRSLSDDLFGDYDRSNFGIAFALMPALHTAGQRIFSKFDGGFSEISANHSFDGGAFRLDVELVFSTGGGGANRVSVSGISPSQWHHIYFRNTLMDGMQLYVNGLLVDAAPATTVYDNGARVYWLETAQSGTLINQPTFFSGGVPTVDKVFYNDGTLRGLGGLDGVYSQLAVQNGDGRYDSIKDVDWSGSGVVSEEAP